MKMIKLQRWIFIVKQMTLEHALAQTWKQSSKWTTLLSNVTEYVCINGTKP